MPELLSKLLPLLFLLAAPAALPAQTTWIVNPGGGPGVHFTDLQAAVNAASHGDTIVVQWGPFQTGVTGFTTNKGLTIVSQGQVFLDSIWTPITISGLPAGRQFRLAGFDAPRTQEMRIVVQNCAGEVLLENLRAVEPGLFSPSGTAIHVSNCALVTLRGVETLGAPAVRVDNSTAVLAACRLGVTSLGLGGGPCLHATDATVDVSEPHFDTGFGSDCITLVRTHLRLGGTSAALVKAGNAVLAVPGTPIVTTLGSVTTDPNVSLIATPANSPAITGTAVVQTRYVPATWCSRAQSGQNATIHSTHPANAVVLQFVGFPGPATATPYGPALLALAPAPVALLAVHVPSAAGTATASIAIPPWALGIGLAAQSLVLGGTNELSTGVHFVVH